MAVYDDEKKRGGTQLTPSDRELQELTGISPTEERRMEAAAQVGASHDIRAREKKAAAGHADPTTNADAGAKAQDRGELRDKEMGGLYKPGTEAKEKKTFSADSFVGKLIGTPGRKRFFAAWFLSTLIGGGAGTALLGYASGPLQFIHASELLSGFHLQDKSDESESRTIALARYAYFYKAGIPENSRLSYMGNKIADKAEARFNKAGFMSAYNDGPFGFYKGYFVDGPQLNGGAFNQLDAATKNDPDKLIKFFEREFNITPTVHESGRLVLNADDLSYRDFIKLSRIIQRASGANYIASATNARYAGVRAGLASIWHPVKRIDYKVQKTLEERLLEWQKKRRSQVLNGASATGPNGVQKEAEGEGDNANTDAADATEGDINDLTEQAEAAHEGGDAKNAFREALEGKIGKVGMSLLGVIDVLCLLMIIHDKMDEVRQDNIEFPLQRLGMQLVALGSQVKSGSTDLEGFGPGSGNEQMSFMAAYMTDKENGTTFFGAESINANLGKTGGEPTPKEFIVDESGPLYKLFGTIENPSAIRTGIAPVCAAVATTIGMIILGAGAVILGGPASAAVGIAFGALALPKIIDWIVNTFSGTQVDTDELKGAALGSAADFGVFHFGNNMAIGNGGLPLTAAQAMERRNISNDLNKEEFQSKNLAYRLFNPEDPRSFMGQVIQQQSTDPAMNVAKYAGGFLNIGHTFASLLGKQLQFATADAAVIPFDYGVPDHGFSVAEMESPDFKHPYENAAKAVALLDAAQNEAGAEAEDNKIVKRAKVCFGVDLVKKPINDSSAQGANPPELWSVDKPVDGQVPQYKTVSSGKIPADDSNTDYDCNNRADKDWTTIRFFILDSQIMNSYFCYEAAAKNTLTQEACTDAGMPTPPANEGNIDV